MNLKGVTSRVRRWVYHPAEYPRGLNVPPAGPPQDWKAENEQRIAMLRARGVKIGRDCVIFTTEFSTEPYLVEIGDHVAVAGGTQFLTHDGRFSTSGRLPSAATRSLPRIASSCRARGSGRTA